MAYTHYFSQTRKVTDGEFKEFVNVCKKLYENLPERTDTAGGYYKDNMLVIGGLYGAGKPVFKSNIVSFNGAGNVLSHESFVIEKNKDDGFNFCKTARKPYDLLVVACLIAAWQFIDYRFSSDGIYNNQCKDLQPAIDYYNAVMTPKIPITEEMILKQSNERKEFS